MIAWWWLVVSGTAIVVVNVSILNKVYDRGLYLGVTCPQRACELLSQRGYEMMEKHDEQ